MDSVVRETHPFHEGKEREQCWRDGERGKYVLRYGTFVQIYFILLYFVIENPVADT